jgi:sulfite reductase (ferredoxin)
MKDDSTGAVTGFNMLVGGGMGRHRNKPETFAAVAQPMAFVASNHVVAASRAVLMVQRDHGDRTNRRHARLKYLIADRGVEWFRDRVQEHLEFPLAEPLPMSWPLMEDHLGWHEQGDGLLYLGIFIENGRIADTDASRLRAGLRAIITELQPEVLLTPQQNVILGGVKPGDRDRIDALLAEHGITPVEELPNAVRYSMACPAWPTCGLATAEAERVLPEFIREVAVLSAELGLEHEPTTYRMTGCPNGCARPYQGDVGFVGTTIGKYDVFLGGDQQGTRLNELYAAAVPIEEIITLLRGPLSAHRDERDPGEGFGDWCHRVGLAALRERFEVATPAASLASAPAVTPLPMHAVPR